jgi:hypothetical protein
MAEPKYIKLFLDCREQLKLLSDEERGRVIMALLDYADTGDSSNSSSELSGAERMCFSFISAQIDRDKAAYTERCKKNAENASKRWKSDGATVCNRIRTDAKNARDKVQTNTKSKDTLTLFERFWEAYPRRIAKATALKSFEKLHVDEALLSKMLAALEKQKKCTQWQDIKFIPHPSTWLNNSRWEDEIDVSEDDIEESGIPEMTREDLERIYQEPVGRTAEEIKAMSMEELFE